jgi:hypothetical protein
MRAVALSRAKVIMPVPGTRKTTGFGSRIAGLSGCRQRDIGVDRGGAAHDVDGVPIELAGDAGGRLVAGEGDHAGAGDEEDDRVRVADRRAVRVPAALVVLGIAGAVVGEPGGKVGSIGREHQRADLRPQEMVGAGCPEGGQFLEAGRVHEFEDLGGIVEMPDLRLVPADQPAYLGHQPGGDLVALWRFRRCVGGTAEDPLAAGLFGQPGDRLVDGGDGGRVALAVAVAPGEEAVALQDDADRLRILAGERLQHQAELEAGPPPGQPADGVAEDLRGQVARVFRGGDGDDRVRVDVVDELRRQEAVEGRVDGGGARIEVEGAVRQVADHLVLVVGPAIELLQGEELLHVEGGEAVELHGAEVAAGALDPEHLDLFAGQRIGLHQLGGGVASAEIGDALVRAEEVGAVEEPLGKAEARGMGLVPLVGEKGIGGDDHGRRDLWWGCSILAGPRI